MRTGRSPASSWPRRRSGEAALRSRPFVATATEASAVLSDGSPLRRRRKRTVSPTATQRRAATASRRRRRGPPTLLREPATTATRRPSGRPSRAAARGRRVSRRDAAAAVRRRCPLQRHWPVGAAESCRLHWAWSAMHSVGSGASDGADHTPCAKLRTSALRWRPIWRLGARPCLPPMAGR